ncbi:hypothetical protein L6452_01763 [Arctium lappa]|uniref:Uncharacterized protein n=1 Tax=Arctium lappa TaxID=4217 RepID=A0ACB9FI72_ARCLA|nr:hypothetical protein L6452_01763 [Arctium lappa]
MKPNRSKDVGYSKLRRHNTRNHPSSAWCVLQVRLPGGVLDMRVVDLVGMDPWGYLRHLCHHQVILMVGGLTSNVIG